jgi:hypothetical protein
VGGDAGQRDEGGVALVLDDEASADAAQAGEGGGHHVELEADNRRGAGGVERDVHAGAGDVEQVLDGDVDGGGEGADDAGRADGEGQPAVLDRGHPEVEVQQAAGEGGGRRGPGAGALNREDAGHRLPGDDEAGRHGRRAAGAEGDGGVGREVGGVDVHRAAQRGRPELDGHVGGAEVQALRGGTDGQAAADPGRAERVPDPDRAGRQGERQSA